MDSLRLTIVISTLGPGGAERVVSAMSNFWAERGTDVTLVTFTPPDEDHYPLHPAVKRIQVELLWRSSGILRRARDQAVRLTRLRRAITGSRPDIVVSFVEKTNVRVLMSLLGTGLPVVVSERSNPDLWTIGPAWGLIRRLLYRRATAVVVQTEQVRTWVADLVDPSCIAVIPNAVRWSDRSPSPMQSSKKHTVAGMGRLSPEKGFDQLITAWSLAAKHLTGWRLLILGDGPERDNLKVQACQLGIDHQIDFTGLVTDPADWLLDTDVFVLPSRFEGFPNALLEAMSLGIASVSFDCDNGPRDIIRDGVDGLLVEPEDCQALADAIVRLASDPSLRAEMSRRAIEVRERFSETRIMKQWESLLHDSLRKRSKSPGD